MLKSIFEFVEGLVMARTQLRIVIRVKLKAFGGRDKQGEDSAKACHCGQHRTGVLSSHPEIARRFNSHYPPQERFPLGHG